MCDSRSALLHSEEYPMDLSYNVQLSPGSAPVNLQLRKNTDLFAPDYDHIM
jgi:hypothetical protein